ncbi:nSTAND1 domain-containing NTPase [Streptomyces termitum]
MTGRERSCGEARGPVMASSVVRVRAGDGAIVGAGFLVADDMVLTCAHVVSDALDLPRDAAVRTGVEVGLDLPFAAGRPAGTATVEHWVPVREDQGGDVAVLRLRAPLPGGRPLPMADAGDLWDHGTRAVGFTEEAPDGTWQQGRLRGPVGAFLVQLSRADGQAVHVRPGFSGSPVWDETLGAVVGMVVASQPVREAQQAFVMRTRALTGEVPGLGGVLLPDKPFLGLRVFEETDAHLFFGRDADIERVVSALRGDHPVVTVCGPSGSGKSSLVRAGVVPRLRALAPGSPGLDVLVVRCGSVGTPRAALATELAGYGAGGPGPTRAEDADRAEARMRELGLADAFHRTTGRTAERLLVVLDQAEALLGLPEPDLAETLDLLFPSRRTGPKVLATLRADVVDAALRHPRLGPVLTAGATLPLAPMTREQLRAVVTRPLESTPGVAYEPGLETRILDDAGTDPGALPLLGFLLDRLWDRQEGGLLSAATYQAIGGVEGALLQHAGDAWRRRVPETGPGREEARRLLAGLVRVIPGGKAVLRRALTREEAGEKRWELARALADERLLVLHGGDGRPESAELAHEALITRWPELAEAVRADADFLTARAEAQHDLERWEREGRRADLLPGGFHLDSLTRRLAGRDRELTGEQRDFLALAHRRRKASRRRARAGWAAGALALAVIATLLAVNALESRLSAQRAAEARSRTLAVQSDELVDTNPGHAALAALAAYGTEPTQEARNALLRRYTEVRDLEWILSGAEGTFEDAAMSADGRVTLVTTGGGRGLLFVRARDGRVRQESLRLRPNVRTPGVSHDGRRISYVRRDDGVVVWHDVTATAERMTGPAHTLGPPALAADGTPMRYKATAFSRNGRFLVESSDDSWTTGVFEQPDLPVRVWDLATGRPKALPKRYSIATAAWFGPDEHTLVLAAASGALITVDVRTGALRRLTESFDTVLKSGDGGSWVSADGTVAVSCRKGDGVATSPRRGARYTAIRVADGRILRTHRWDDEERCGTVLLDAGGKRFARGELLESDWDVLETSGDASPWKATGPSLGFDDGVSFPLLGTAREPVVPVRRKTAIVGRKLTGAEGDTAYGVPQLLGDGSTMLVRTGRDGEKLKVVETEGENRVRAEVTVTSAMPPARGQLIAVNPAKTLMADVRDGNRVTVRRLPSLEKAAEFTVARPPLVKEGGEERQPVSLDFQPDDRLVTLSGTRVEHWDTGDGHRVDAPVDLAGLRLSSLEEPEYAVVTHRVPGVIGVHVSGEPDLYAVDLATGRERKDLRITFGEDLLTASFLQDSRYLAVLTTGRIVELWSAGPGRPPRRVLGPFGPLEPGEFTVGNPAGAGFFVAYGSTAVFLKADDPLYRDTYEFGADQRFAATNVQSGTALLGTPASEDLGSADRFRRTALRLTRLDPGLWTRHLCRVLGRGLTPDERSGLPGALPDELCPPGGPGA